MFRLMLAGIVSFALMATGAMAAQPADLTPLQGARCGAVPCGPIPVIITIKLDQDTRDLTFPAGGVLEIKGEVIYYFDVDQDGYGYDPQSKPVIKFKTPRTVDWVNLEVDPPEVPVPIDDPTMVKQDDPSGAPEQTSYEYRHPITVTLTKTREPSPTEMEATLRSDGKYRILLAANSNGSTLDAAGTQYGLIEGYGVRELRFNPSSDPSGSAGGDGGNAPGAGMLAVLAGLAAATLVAARLQRF